MVPKLPSLRGAASLVLCLLLLTVGVFVSGTAGDSLSFHRNMAFSTKDRTMINTRATVPHTIKVLGGTTTVFVPT